MEKIKNMSKFIAVIGIAPFLFNLVFTLMFLFFKLWTNILSWESGIVYCERELHRSIDNIPVLAMVAGGFLCLAGLLYLSARFIIWFGKKFIEDPKKVCLAVLKMFAVIFVTCFYGPIILHHFGWKVPEAFTNAFENVMGGLLFITVIVGISILLIGFFKSIASIFRGIFQRVKANEKGEVQ